MKPCSNLTDLSLKVTILEQNNKTLELLSLKVTILEQNNKTLELLSLKVTILEQNNKTLELQLMTKNKIVTTLPLHSPSFREFQPRV